MATEYLSKSESDTIHLGMKLAGQLKKGDIIGLSGDLGSGKTTLAKGMAKALKVNQHAVNSPTFVLLNVYEGKLPLFHFDLYRLDKPQDILGIGYEDYFYGEGVSVIEWAQKLGPLLPKDYLAVHLVFLNEGARLIQFVPYGKRAKDILKSLKI